MTPARPPRRVPGRVARLWSLLALALLAGCTSPGERAANDGHFGPFIAIMAAFEPELAANEEVFLQGGHAVSTNVIHGLPFKHVRFEGHDLLLFPSGISMVNAAMNTQLALDRYPISHVLFAGVAGGINPAHHIGDVVVPEKWFHHSEAAYLNPRPDGTGYVKPEYFKPPYENFGFIFPDHVWAIRDGMDQAVRQASFDADPLLLDLARQAIPAIPPMEFRGRRAVMSVGGNGIAGPVFMDNREYRKWAFRVWHADCLDMESTAIAQVCWANRRPFLIVRSLSDLAGGQDGINDADHTEVPVARHASLVLREIVRRLPKAR